MSLFIINQKEKNDLPLKNTIAPQTFLNVPYGNDQAQKMDIYLPARHSDSATPLIILIHGGGWNSGNKSNFGSYIDSFKQRMPHYAIFNINYRLVQNNHLFPTQENDIKNAISFIVSRTREYAIDSNRIVLLGASAGAHLALLQAYKYKQPKIRAVIDYFGPTDLLSMYQHPWHPMVPYALQMVTGTSPDVNPDLYKNSSPVRFVNKDVPPTLIFHGGKDPVVDLSQSKELKIKLDQNNVSNKLIVYAEEGHGFYGKTLSRSFDEIEKFMKGI